MRPSTRPLAAITSRERDTKNHMIVSYVTCCRVWSPFCYNVPYYSKNGPRTNGISQFVFLPFKFIYFCCDTQVIPSDGDGKIDEFIVTLLREGKSLQYFWTIVTKKHSCMHYYRLILHWQSWMGFLCIFCSSFRRNSIVFATYFYQEYFKMMISDLLLADFLDFQRTIF